MLAIMRTLDRKAVEMAFRISSYPHVQVLMKKSVVGGNNAISSIRPDVACF